jgi:fructokinase
MSSILFVFRVELKEMIDLDHLSGYNVIERETSLPASEVTMRRLYGGIEAGGTKFVCVVAGGPQDIRAETRFPTSTPEQTLEHVLDFFRPYTSRGELAAVGIGAFGPLDLNPDSPTYGSITTTPKPGWAQVDLLGAISRGLGIPVCLDTDVNAAAFGEQFWIAENRELDCLIYMTVGTGVGVGAIVHKRPLHGLIHPEIGHIFIPHSQAEDPFEGVCPYHGDCLEGLTSGPAMRRRWGVRAEDLAAGHPGWDLEAKYLALGVCNLILAFSPQRVVLGGGVLQHPGLIDQVRQQVSRLLNGYIQSEWLGDRIEEYIASPGLGNRAGVLGAVAMAMALEEKKV